jgi:fatty acid desaturase
MSTMIPPRLRKPLGLALAGLVFAGAWLVRGGPLWWVSIMTVIATAIRVVGMYRTGGQDTDEGALAGSRADERQNLVGLRSRALAANSVMVAAFLGLVMAIALRAPWWWPFLVILAVAGLGYLFGLSAYGADAEDPAGEVGAASQRRSPVNG